MTLRDAVKTRIVI